METSSVALNSEIKAKLDDAVPYHRHHILLKRLALSHSQQFFAR